ncbi:transmembrane protein 200A [Gadus macrocephalus]|uniref:transmembrane protein 200A n=1 Tax=Gadus macrocephalus TaxID=80720 RepID=UPI0028CB5FD8|nr:transmembrane protein 200A [Gadus macrocephalus]
MKTKGLPTLSPSHQTHKSRFSLRSKKKKAGVIRGKLRIRSIPGAFLVLGIVVVVVGTGLAVAGYWPYRISRASMLGPGEAEGVSNTQTSSWSLGAKSLLTTAGLIHSERMKLLGPVIMGVGLFILICANTVLYENRDRETQVLLAQMRNVICSVSAVVPSAELTEMAVTNSMAKHYQWVSTLPAAHLNILCLQASSEPLLITRTQQQQQQEETAEGKYQRAVQWTQALHHQESASTPSLHSSSSSHNSSATDLTSRLNPGREAAAAAAAAAAVPPVRPASSSQYSNCLVSASSMSTLEGEDPEVATPRRCHSVSYRTNPRGAPLLREGGREERGGPRALRREASLQVYVNVPEQSRGPPPSEGRPSEEEEAHRSWPRLDLGCGRRYLKLENKEDSVDRLLDQMEQQCSPWDKSFGSGPFQ